ncbi:MAG: hypothetical protein Q7K26_01320 [bacterium]|nr:hypothetical protein [bacterium]
MNDQEFNLRFREYKETNGMMALEHYIGPKGDVIVNSVTSDTITLLEVDSRELCEVTTTEFKKSYVWIAYDEMQIYMTTDAAQLAALSAGHQRIVQAQLHCLNLKVT